MRRGDLDAVLLDLDGVVTPTARVHARAWKAMFDDFLARPPAAAAPAVAAAPVDARRSFDIEADYRSYVDGKPRYDGVRCFLESRGIVLPEGSPDDPHDRPTVCGLGNRKDDMFLDILRRDGVEPFEDAAAMIAAWRAAGLKTAVVSASRNCAEVVEAAGLTASFDARVDGVTAEDLGLPGKPAPDTFLEAARRLGVAPGRAVVVEDAEAGVEAGRRGGFAFVVGVARTRDAAPLRDRGADIVVASLREFVIAGIPVPPARAAADAGPAPPGRRRGNDPGEGAA